MRNPQGLALMSAVAFVLAAGPATSGDLPLTGTIKSSSGEALAGVTVSAKPDGQPITTSVYTDEAGHYYFPALPSGKYRVWAQALSFEAGRGEIAPSPVGD